MFNRNGPRRSLRRTPIVVLAASVLLTLAAATPGEASGNGSVAEFVDDSIASAADPVLATEEQLASGREALGFDPLDTKRLLQSPEALGRLDDLGFLLSEDEAALYFEREDLVARLDTVIASAPSVPGFAGMRLEHTGAGIFHFHFADPTEIDAFAATIPTELQERVEIQTAAFPEAALIDEMTRLWSVIDPAVAESVVVSISVDVTANGLVALLNSDPSVGSQLASTAAALVDAAEVPIAISFGPTESDANCANRSDCDYPMRGGIRINQESRYGSYGCTMGFHARLGSNEVFITSGHCGLSGSTAWYHPGYGYLGSQKENVHSTGDDVMSVDMPDSQASNKIYWNTTSTRNVTGYYPNSGMWEGMSICMSGRVSGNLCGTITTVAQTWGGNPTMYGADASFIPYFGDSGAPVYQNSSGYKAVGVVATTGGAFVRIQDALVWLDLSLITS